MGLTVEEERTHYPLNMDLVHIFQSDTTVTIMLIPKINVATIFKTITVFDTCKQYLQLLLKVCGF